MFILTTSLQALSEGWNEHRIELQDDKDISTGISKVVTDNSGFLHILYTQGVGLDKSLYYKTNKSGLWETDLISNDKPSDLYNLEVDSNGYVHFLYGTSYDNEINSAVYVVGNHENWINSPISAGRSMSLDTNGKVHIIGTVNGNLTYTSNTSGSFVEQTILVGAGYGATIAVDSNNKVHISFLENSSGGGNYTEAVYGTNVAGAWLFNTLTQYAHAGNTYIKVDENDFAHILFEDNGNLMYSTNTSGLWTTVDTGTGGDFSSSYFMQDNGTIHVFKNVYNNSSATYSVSHTSNEAGNWETETINLGYANAISYYINKNLSDNNGFLTIVYAESLFINPYAYDELKYIQRGDKAITPDFNNDSVADILWRDSTNGTTVIWFMNADGTQKGHHVLGTISTDWEVKTIIDFNNDAISDIVWRNVNTGMTVVWLMNSDGTQLTYQFLGYVDPVWKLSKLIDFNGDSVPDIFWRNSTTGMLVIWFLNPDGSQKGYHIVGTIDPTWEIKAVSDYNDNSVPDIMWRNSSDGMIVLWYMNADGTQDNYDIVGTISPLWKIEGVRDFNGDSYGDIVWRNTQDGMVVIWFMDDYGSQNGYHIVGTIDPLWQINTIEQFNIGTAPTITWRNSLGGTTVLWFMNADGTQSGYHILGTISTNWEIQNEN